jgi:hypothetical protein
MKRCAVLVPILGRPGHVGPLVKSLRDSGADARIVLICNHDDAATIAACRCARREPMIVPWAAGYADWARKLNYAWPLVEEEWRLHGADDIRFTGGWLDEALQVADRFAACVVGTNDLGNPRVTAGVHATHQLVHRDYWECGTIDEAGKVVTEAYHHNFVDDEFVQTAMSRSTYASARRSIIEHLHPDWGKGEEDSTYMLGRSQFGRDAVLFNQRCVLWAAALRRCRNVPVV